MGGVGNQVPGLNKATGDRKTYEAEVYGQLQTLRQCGNGGDVGLQILNYLRQAGGRVAEITNVGCQEIEKSGRDNRGRVEMVDYRQNMRGRVMNTMEEYMGTFFERRMSEFGGCFGRNGRRAFSI